MCSDQHVALTAVALRPGAPVDRSLAVPPWAPGMGAAVVAGAAALFLHRKGVFASAVVALRQRLQGPASQSQGAPRVRLLLACGRAVPFCIVCATGSGRTYRSACIR